MSCEKWFCILQDNEDLYSTDNTEEGDNEEDEVSIYTFLVAIHYILITGFT